MPPFVTPDIIFFVTFKTYVNLVASQSHITGLRLAKVGGCSAFLSNFADTSPFRMAMPEACLYVQTPGCPLYLKMKPSQRFRHVHNNESYWLYVLFEAKCIIGRNGPCVSLNNFINQTYRTSCAMRLWR